MKSGRGRHMIEKSKQTRLRIEKFIIENPGAIRKEVCDSLGISYLTLRRHLSAINDDKLQE